MVFQSYALFPHMNIFDNVAYGLKLRHVPKAEIRTKVFDMLKLVGLEGMENRFTNQLSGDQQQRVALARALIVEPGVLLFDEPLSNLDAKLRVYMRTEIRRIQQQFGITAVYVTHDQSEAMSISDQIIIMNKGVIAQMGTPQEIYYSPASEFVADFIGEANFLKVQVDGVESDVVNVNLGGIRFPVKRPAGAVAKGEEHTLMLRPEGIRVSETGILPCKVVLSCFMGSYQNYHVMVGDTLVRITDNHPVGRRIFNVGEEAYLDFSPVDTHLM